jgi:hypothetical protein
MAEPRRRKTQLKAFFKKGKGFWILDTRLPRLLDKPHQRVIINLVMLYEKRLLVEEHVQ